MNTYKFDFKEIIHGSVEIEAEHGLQAEEKFMQMSLKDLLRLSAPASDGTARKIRFVDADPKAIKQPFIETSTKEIHFIETDEFFGLDAIKWDKFKEYL
jgi:hypothetical protein